MRQIALALLLAAVMAAGLRWGTFVAGGSDSYCYAHQAERWASGRLHVVEPLALEAPWPDAPGTFAPAGHIPSPVVRGAVAPICPAGLALLMTPFRLLGGRDAIFLVVPLLGALLVGATFVLGSRYGPRVGLVSAVLAACSPAFLYQLVQPMSDVPAAALWVAAAAAATGTKRRAALVAGVAAAVAIVVRPNLVPVGVPIGLFFLLRPERTRAERLRAGATYAACVAGGCAAVGLIQTIYYGSPFSSGYGSLAVLFDAANIAPNARRYASWMTGTHTPLWLIAAAAPLALPGALSRLLAGMVIVNVALYLPYVVFDDWWYLRFLLPAIPVVLVLVVATIDAACRRTWPPVTAPVLTIVALVLATVFLRQANDRSVFRLHELEAPFADAGRYVAARLPAAALVVTNRQSGSIRHYSGRRTLAWERLDPAWLDRAIAFARGRGLQPFLLLERAEEPAFRARFAASGVGRLDWPPMAEIGSHVRIYRPEDRERYLRGERVTTEYAR